MPDINPHEEIVTLKAVLASLPAGPHATALYELLVGKVAKLTARWAVNGNGTPAKLASIALPPLSS